MYYPAPHQQPLRLVLRLPRAVGPNALVVVGAMVARPLAGWVGLVPTSLVARPMALGTARAVLCGRWGLCNSCRNTMVYPKPVHVVGLRLEWLDIWCKNGLAVCSRGMSTSLAVWAALSG